MKQDPTSKRPPRSGETSVQSVSEIAKETCSEVDGNRLLMTRKQLIQELKSALTLGANNFLLAYNLRGLLAVSLHLFKLARKRPSDLLSLKKIVHEDVLKFRVDAVSLGLLVGGFSGGYRALMALFRFMRQRREKWHNLLAGTLAGTAIVFMDEGRRRTLALYLLARALQCGYNAFKSRGWWHFWGSSWTHGDSLLFALTSAQVMYAYVMRPNTLPSEYNQFIVRTGPIHPEVLRNVRRKLRGKAFDMSFFQSYVAKFGRDPQLLPATLTSDMVPCQILHPWTESHLQMVLTTFRNAFCRTFPFYLSLSIAPAIVLRFNAFARRPLQVLSRVVANATQSTTFLASFVATYQAATCAHRVLTNKDHKLMYYLFGFIASWTILIEKKDRRSELALYVLPRAADSLYMILRHRRLLAAVPFGETLLFSLSMGVIMYFYEFEGENMSPLLRKLLGRFLEYRTK